MSRIIENLSLFMECTRTSVTKNVIHHLYPLLFFALKFNFAPIISFHTDVVCRKPMRWGQQRANMPEMVGYHIKAISTLNTLVTSEGLTVMIPIYRTQR